MPKTVHSMNYYYSSTSQEEEEVAAYLYSSILNHFYDEDEVSTITAATAGGSEVERLIWAYCSPPIFVIGIVGNILTILVTSRRPTSRTSSGVYLFAMSLGAIGVYLFGFLSQWLRACGFVDITELGPWSCRFNKFIYYSSGDVAIWTLSLLNVDRLVAVCFPLHKAAVCTRRRAVTLTVVVIVLAVAKNTHLFWTKGTVYTASNEVLSHCGAPQPHTHFEKFVRPWIVFAVVTILPVAVIITCNTLIIRQLARSRKIRQFSARGGERKKRGTRMTTTMCLGASLSFILFASPSIILVVLKPYYPGVPYDIAKAVNNLLVHVNYAANFFLYCLGGHSFRSRLRLLLCRRRSGRRFHFDRSITYLVHQYRTGDSELTCSIKTSRSNSTTLTGSSV